MQIHTKIRGQVIELLQSQALSIFIQAAQFLLISISKKQRFLSLLKMLNAMRLRFAAENGMLR